MMGPPLEGYKKMIEELPEGKPNLRKRGVAQPGSASALGAEGQKFESSHPDQDPEPVDFKSDGTRWRYQTRLKQREETVTVRPTWVEVREIDHIPQNIFYNRDKNSWWFSDETAAFNGPYDTMNQAVAALELYVEQLG